MDREKVIGHLNDCMEASRRDNTWVFVRKDIVEDAILLLKEQELTKAKPRPEKLLPCKCGCKRREHWCSSDKEKAKILKCVKCGFEVAGKNEIDVHAKWNKAVGGL